MLPNFNELNSDKGEDKGNKTAEPVLSFSYDNTKAETENSLKVFTRRYGSKRGHVMIAAYCVFVVAAVMMLISDPTRILLYVALVLAIAFVVVTASAPARRRKKIIARMESMPPEDYECCLYSDKVVIKTFVRPKGEEDSPEPVIQLFPFSGEYVLEYEETDFAVLLFVNGATFFCFPKRCMTEEQKKALLEIFNKSLII